MGLIQERWSNLENQAQTIISSLDSEAGKLCALYQGRAQEFINNLENLPRNAAKVVGQTWLSLKQEAQAAWQGLMLKVDPAIKIVREKWSEFSNWTKETVWNPINEKVGEAKQWIEEKVGRAGEWVNEKWSGLSEKATVGWNWLQEKASIAQELVSTQVNTARQWVSGKGQQAWNWLERNFSHTFVL